MKRLVLIIAAIALICAPADAQNMLGRLKERAKNAVENNLGNKVEKATNAILDGKIGKKKDKDKNNSKDENTNTYDPSTVTEPAVEETTPDAVTQNVKNDFVRGSVIMFEDTMVGEQVGEFPSKWDLERGNAEIAKVNGETCIAMMTDDSFQFNVTLTTGSSGHDFTGSQIFH